MFRTNLFLLFVVVPIVEIALLIQVGQLLGFWPTLALVVGTAAIGSSIAAREGTAALAALTQPGTDSISSKIADAAIILVCGFLLLTPGIVTDVVGLLGLFPVTRPAIRKIVLKQFGKRMKVTTFSSSGTAFRTGHEARPQGQPGSPSDGTGSGPIVSGTASETPGYSREEVKQ